MTVEVKILPPPPPPATVQIMVDMDTARLIKRLLGNVAGGGKIREQVDALWNALRPVDNDLAPKIDWDRTQRQGVIYFVGQPL